MVLMKIKLKGNEKELKRMPLVNAVPKSSHRSQIFPVFHPWYSTENTLASCFVSKLNGLDWELVDVKKTSL
jgi:hypothetical protein